VHVANDLAFLAVQGEGMQVVDVSHPDSPVLISQFSCKSSTRIFVCDTMAYLNADSLRIINVADPEDPVLMASHDYYAYDYFVQDHFIYTAGIYYGFRIFDATAPESIYVTGEAAATGSVRYGFVADTLAYLSCWNSGLNIVDISDPAAPEVIGNYYDPDLDAEKIAVDDAVAYLVHDSGLLIIDVSDPTNPQPMSEYITPSYCRAVAVRGDFAFLAYYRYLCVLDITDPSHPDSVPCLEFDTYPDVIKLEDTLAYAFGTLHMNIVNIADPTNPSVVSHYRTASTVRDVCIKGNMVYVAGGSTDLEMIDVSDPTVPQQVFRYRSGDIFIQAMDIRDTTLFIAGVPGVALINIADPESPWIRGVYDTPGTPRDIYVLDSTIYVMDYGSFMILRETSWIGQPDLAFDSLDITFFSPDSVLFYYRIKNVGAQPANLEGPTDVSIDNVNIMAYVSTDTIYINGNDMIAGFYTVRESPAGVLVPGDTISGIVPVQINVDTSSFKYLTLKIDATDVVEEMDEDNNTAAAPLTWICYPDLPDPVFAVESCGEIYYWDEGYGYHYDFSVPNRDEFPDELFKPAPNLPPCGTNPNSSRSWVNIRDKYGSNVYGFCILDESQDLNDVWFGRPYYMSIPDSVYLTIWDRACDIVYSSNLVATGGVSFEPFVRYTDGDVDTTLYEPTEICVELTIRDADTIIVDGGRWADDQLCFDALGTGHYLIIGRAQNSCGTQSFYLYADIYMPIVQPTSEWINVHCDNPMLNYVPLRPGDTIEAYDADGILCGRDTVRTDGSFGFMPIYRDDESSDIVDEGAEPGDTITFKVNGIDVKTDPIVWTENGDSFELCHLFAEECLTYNLPAGWNLISWNVDYTDEATAFISDFSGCVSKVLGFDQGGLTYDPNLIEFSTLEQVDYHYGYWLRLSCDAAFEICGYPVKHDDGIAVYSGWNLAGYWPDDSLPVEDGLSSIYGCLDAVLGYDNGGLTWVPDNPDFNSLDYLKPGFGYWIRSDCDTMLAYGGFAPEAPFYAAKSGVKPVVYPSRTWMPVYGANIMIDEAEPDEGSKVEAFTEDGTLCGAGRYSNGVLKFTPVYGRDAQDRLTAGYPEEGDAVAIYVNGQRTYPAIPWYADHEPVAISNRLSYESDLIPREFSLHQNYPNPFNPNTVIDFALPRAADVKIDIYNILGKKVTSLLNGQLEAGHHSIIWNGLDSKGKETASGVYFCSMKAGEFAATRKMLLLK
ncbi:MAG: T9SS type A sorting domain-containing protein, partial [Candidatus Zixiibacteriota bacterium]